MSYVGARKWFVRSGGVNPFPVQEPSGWRLSFAEREEIALLHARGEGVNQIAREIGRAGSTVSRELHRSCVGQGGYRPSVAQAHADRLARRPKDGKLATCGRLRAQVQARLRQRHSPEQIAARLRCDFPDDPEMWVSHETIYRALYVQGRGGLRRELVKELRTGRALRKPRRRAGSAKARPGQIVGMVNIAERPPEAADRAVPGHWEGDLIAGSANKSVIGTLVERATGYLILLRLPQGYSAAGLQVAMAEAMSRMPATLRRTLTWDQGREMASHVQIAAATGLQIYFCDPHSPWQRGSNENTNGLLRQYFPKDSDLSFHGQGILEAVAAELNNRPRKRLGWATPAEALDALLSKPPDRPGVAMTA